MSSAEFHTRPLMRCGCGKAAEVEVYNSRGASYGVFCKPHGGQHLKQLNKRYRDVPADRMPRA